MSNTVAEHHALERFVSQSPVSGEPAISVVIASAHRFFNVRGAAGDAAFSAAMNALIGAPLPAQPNTYVNGNLRAFWLGPNEWLLSAVTDNDVTAQALGSVPGASAVDVSDGYVQLTLAGVDARKILAKGCTLDLHPRVFHTGCCAQTAIARTAVLLTANDDPGQLGVVVRRTFAEYLASWLQHSAGSGVSFHIE